MCLSFFSQTKQLILNGYKHQKSWKEMGLPGNATRFLFFSRTFYVGCRLLILKTTSTDLCRRWEQRNLGRTKKSLPMYSFFPIASLLRLGSLHFFTISVPAAALYPTTTFQIKVWRCLAYICVRSKSNDTNLVRASTTALDIRFFSWIFSCSLTTTNSTV